MPNSLAGDICAALGAIFYALYSLQLRVRIPDESRVDMTLLFGLIGASNMLLAWPLFPLLHATRIEAWVGFPSWSVLGFLTLNGLVGTVVSDFLWAKSVLLTSPLIASLGLALTVPLAIVVDVLLNGAAFTLLSALGGLAVLAGFVLVNVEHKKKEDRQQQHEQQHLEEEDAAEDPNSVAAVLAAVTQQEHRQRQDARDTPRSRSGSSSATRFLLSGAGQHSTSNSLGGGEDGSAPLHGTSPGRMQAHTQGASGAQVQHQGRGRSAGSSPQESQGSSSMYAAVAAEAGEREMRQMHSPTQQRRE